jgi:predicted transcriptional regulator
VRYRSHLQIVAEILEIVRDGARKTHIMYRANLSYKLLCKYLDEVLKCGLVRVDKSECYVVAPKGERFLERFYSYLKRRNRVHEELKAVDEEKALLEMKYVNSQGKSASIKGGSGSKGRRGVK